MEKTYKIEFIDKWSRGNKITTIAQDMFRNETEVINFYGLNEPDVEWYEITEVENMY